MKNNQIIAGKVIGKKGVVISNLKRETKVELINALQPIGNSLWVPVVILGKFKPITAAYNEISRMVFEGLLISFFISAIFRSLHLFSNQRWTM